MFPGSLGILCVPVCSLGPWVFPGSEGVSRSTSRGRTCGEKAWRAWLLSGLCAKGAEDAVAAPHCPWLTRDVSTTAVDSPCER